jgi:hypothetical protein
MVLAHDLRTDVEASYQRSDLLEKRRALMLEWEQFALGAKQQAARVVP